MKHRITLSIMALGLALPAMNLQAQDDARPRRGPQGERPGPAFLVALDANKDGTLDKEEIAAASEALKKLDKDSDGKLTMAELRGAPGRGPNQGGERPRGPGGGERPGRQQTEAAAGQRPPMMPPVIATLDKNNSGEIEADELAAAPTALLKLDKNSDGQLTQDELRMGGRPRGGGQRGDRPGASGERPRGEGRGGRGPQ